MASLPPVLGFEIGGYPMWKPKCRVVTISLIIMIILYTGDEHINGQLMKLYYKIWYYEVMKKYYYGKHTFYYEKL
jgi:hypothetical protein